MGKEGGEVFIFRDIEMDGMLCGGNVESRVGLAEGSGKKVIGSGGVSGVSDVEKV
ncbi:HisA/HisF-related TIM barrel protein [Bacillus altitudinis]|uniref:HisA/HisF-related TIM barrel protein n=1 Tax=Bacillus altitudinis TaxID=293387 RepID=UPI0023549A24|nr:HisA/HisF-related TIM barrel protein [Bacillus altitudinis]